MKSEFRANRIIDETLIAQAKERERVKQVFGWQERQGRSDDTYNGADEIFWACALAAAVGLLLLLVSIQ